MTNPIFEQKMEAQHSGAAGFGIVQSAGYNGSNDRVAAAINHMFAPEIAVLAMSTPVAAASMFTGSDFGSQAVAAAAGIKGQIGGRS